jgi:hypothetical protein
MALSMRELPALDSAAARCSGGPGNLAQPQPAEETLGALAMSIVMAILALRHCGLRLKRNFMRTLAWRMRTVALLDPVIEYAIEN